MFFGVISPSNRFPSSDFLEIVQYIRGAIERPLGSADENIANTLGVGRLHSAFERRCKPVVGRNKLTTKRLTHNIGDLQR